MYFIVFPYLSEPVLGAVQFVALPRGKFDATHVSNMLRCS
ncbi:hypothetical protein RB2083_2023 [Rhodobacteraceae bacterium HTCC2083]|nr:hypothetical protein RB2083_2023 [Rhodobacteraceae bacterium HTCC2083]